jgi:hypothetical protein
MSPNRKRKVSVPPKSETRTKEGMRMIDGIGRRGTALEGAWFAMAEHFGGVAALADVLGVSPTTIYRWGVQGATVPGPASKVIAILCAQNGLRNPLD